MTTLCGLGVRVLVAVWGLALRVSLIDDDASDTLNPEP